jgi:hypothetical protein
MARQYFSKGGPVRPSTNLTIHKNEDFARVKTILA